VASPVRGAYWQGVRLWEILQSPDPWAQRTTDALHQGVEQQYAARNADSPNFSRGVKVRCVVDPIDAGLVGDMPTWMALRVQMMDVEKDLVARALATPLGDLSFCWDVNQKATVTGGAYSGDNAVVGHTAPAAGWVRTAGHYVLARNPTTGEGFCSVIEAIDSSATDVTIDIPTGYSVTTAWSLVNVGYVLPDCAYRTMFGGTPEEWEERGIPDVVYELDCESDPLFAAAHIIAHDN
jgi:hypothetical protein